MKESLDKIKEEVEDIIGQLEHKIYLLEEQHGDPLQIVAYYKQIQDEAKKAADKFRAQGQKDSSEYVRNMQKQWWEAHDAIIDTMKDMNDKITSEHENAIKLLENQLDRALDTDKINKAYQRTVRLKVDTKQLNSVQSIMKETSTAAANSLVNLGLGFGSLASAMASAQRVINSLQPVTVDIISSSIDGDAIEDYMNQTIEHYRAMQENIHKEADYYRSQGYSDLSDEVSELSDKWWEYEDAVKDVKQKVVDYLSDIVDKASESVDEIQDVLSTFKDAAKEYSTNGGFISVDTFQEISKLGLEYMGYLQDENGLLAINEEKINNVIKAKTEQMALETAMAYVEQLRLALQKDSIEDLNQLLSATADLTEVQWGSVYAQLAMLGLTEDGYAAAVQNISNYRSMMYNALSGVGFDFDDAKDGIDEIYEYVKEMIKDNVDRQVDALGELKDKYAEIIDLKKESLQASKDEADYQDEVADKVKEMAKLQEKINALALDDSRSSVAKRKELEEQLADAQKELSKTQADEAYDKQTDNLDKMQEAYEKQKDAEIKKLQESIQSAQKLDDAVRKYIRENWGTLYDTLYKWNYEYGSHLSTELESSWDKALKAAKQYGDYLTALDAVGSSGSNANKTGSSNIVGSSNKYADSEMSKANGIVAKMQANSEKWKQTSSKKERDALHDANEELRRELESKYQLKVTYDSKTGTWGVDGEKANLYNKYYGVYHTGGVVGDASTLRQDEMMAILQKGEIVLDAKKQKSLDSLMRIASAITTGINSKFISPSAHVLDGIKAGYNRDAVPTTTNNQAVNISFGDTIINGEKGDTLK